MKQFAIKVPAKSMKEAKAMEVALREDDIRAFVIIVSALKPFSPQMQSLIVQTAYQHVKESQET